MPVQTGNVVSWPSEIEFTWQLKPMEKPSSARAENWQITLSLTIFLIGLVMIVTSPLSAKDFGLSPVISVLGGLLIAVLALLIGRWDSKLATYLIPPVRRYREARDSHQRLVESRKRAYVRLLDEANGKLTGYNEELRTAVFPFSTARFGDERLLIIPVAGGEPVAVVITNMACQLDPKLAAGYVQLACGAFRFVTRKPIDPETGLQALPVLALDTGARITVGTATDTG